MDGTKLAVLVTSMCANVWPPMGIYSAHTPDQSFALAQINCWTGVPMPKRDAMKQRLRAADRRRKRRGDPSAASTASATATVSPPSDGPDAKAVDLIVSVLLDHAEELGGNSRDVIALAALRGTLRGSVPSGRDSMVLAERLNQLPQLTVTEPFVGSVT